MRALVEGHLASTLPEVETATFPSGAALRIGNAAWILAEGDAADVLGGALAWARRNGAASLSIIAELGGGQLARRAGHFGMPIEVWYPHSRVLLPAVPTTLAPPAQPSAAHLQWLPIIEAAGAEPVVEHGVVAGEVHGLEVCRVVDEPTHGALADVDGLVPDILMDTVGGAGDPSRVSVAETGAILEVGVGAADRQAFALLHGDVPTPDALRAVIDRVRARAPGAPHHPLNRLCRERMLRWSLCRDPAPLGVVELEPVESPLVRRALRDVAPCVAVGQTAEDGAPSSSARSASTSISRPMSPMSSTTDR